MREYEVNLHVGLLLRDILEENGATVIMTRITNDVDISNSQRAILFNEAKTDYAIRLHCDGSNDGTKHGVSILIPKVNPYVEECRAAAEALLAAYCETTGLEARGIAARGDQTGFNWCERMIINIEMGYMTNQEDDLYITAPENQAVMAQALADGILRYFELRQSGATPQPQPQPQP